MSLDNRTPFYFNGNHICLKALKIDIYHETGQPYEIKKLCILKNFLFTIYIYIYIVGGEGANSDIKTINLFAVTYR